MLSPLAHVMRYPIDLEPALRGGAVEIEHVTTNRVLAAELYAASPATQFSPQQAFGQRRGFALGAGESVVVAALVNQPPPSALRAATSPSLLHGEGLNTLHEIPKNQKPRPAVEEGRTGSEKAPPSLEGWGIEQRR